jgi:LmbE family N-acetylglucosaminyl deacetylase
MCVKRLLITVIAAVLLLPEVLQSQPAPSPDAVELKLALKKLTFLGSALYIAAHPDDENTALLTYLTKGRLIRAAYLSTTRGEGGQNLIGPEQGDLLGIIRTQELLAARRIDGAEQFFTRAIDFGYSKTSEEALRVWNKQEILSDMVWIIRKFRPDVIITRFSPTTGGHGQHMASAILAQEAFEAAGDSLQFEEQFRYTSPWKPKRLLFNVSRFQSPVFDSVNAIKIDVGGYSPLLGRSYTEISGMSRSMHKSQGFGATQNRGTNINYFLNTAGDSANVDFFDGVDITWSRIKGGKEVGALLQSAYDAYVPENPSAIIPTLLKAHRAMEKLSDNAWVAIKRKELAEIIRVCAGLWVDATSNDFSATPGSELSVTLSAINRSFVPITLTSVNVSPISYDSTFREPLPYNIPVNKPLKLSVPTAFPLTQPYWLSDKPEGGHYSITDRNLMVHPENAPALTVLFNLSIDTNYITIPVPVQYRWTDPVEGDMYRPLEIVPRIAVNLVERNFIFPSSGKKNIPVYIKSNEANIAGNLRIKLPEGWKADQGSIPFSFERKNEERKFTFAVSALPSATTGTFSIEAETGDSTISKGMTTIRYPELPMQTVFPAAEGTVQRLNLKRAKKNIGYIMGAGDAIPAALEQSGYTVTPLSDEDLSDRNLSSFETIIAGVRAYNTRPGLRTHQNRLMEYVKNGGTYIVQYVTLQGREAENLGPFPFTVSRDRVSVENAPVTFNSKHPVFTSPNKITEQDFEGWIQERGLYFADKWDSAYTAPLACNDPGETSKSGGLLMANYGKGLFVYTGYSFFRQLPAGIGGAYRLFVNLVEARTHR